MSFDELKINDNILRGVYGHGFEKPSSIQIKSIPIILVIFYHPFLVAFLKSF